MPTVTSTPMPEPIKIDPKDFTPAPRVVSKIDPKDFTPAKPAVDPPDPSVMDPHPVESGLKRIGRTVGRYDFSNPQNVGRVATAVAGAAPYAAAAVPEVGVPAKVGLMALGGAASPALQYLVGKATNQPVEPPTAGSTIRSAGVAAGSELAIPPLAEGFEAVVEHVLGIRGASAAVREAQAKAPQEAAELAAKQSAIRAEQVTAQKTAARTAIAEHSDAVSEAEKLASDARAKLRENRIKAAEAARPEAAEKVGESQVQGMIGKTPKQFQREAAQPYKQRAAALSQASDPYFSAASKFHTEVGQKFEPYIRPIRNSPLPPDTESNIQQTVSRIDQTLEQRGQRIESAELNKITNALRAPEAQVSTEKVFGSKLDLADPKQRKLAEQMGQLKQAESDEPPTTYGQLWGIRARTSRVLASAKNPADRAAANDIINSINDAIPGVPPELRSQYAFERKVNRSVVGNVATARTPQEVGDAVFGTKSKPLPAEIPLQTIRFTKKYAPDQMDGLRQAFADHYIGNGMTANDLGKMNPEVLRELYGDKSDSVVRLLGPEGDLKQASWGKLIAIDPKAQKMLEDGIRDSMTKQTNLAQRQAITEGEAALRELGPKYADIQQRVKVAPTPEAKLKILQQEMPDPDKMAKEALGKLGAGRMEGYFGRRLLFMGALAAMGGYGHLAKRPELVTASIMMGAALGLRGAARYALSTETGADVFMKALSMEPTPQNAATMGKILAPMTALGINQTLDQAQSQPSATP